MSRYFFNENPQVTLWRQKCEELKENVKVLTGLQNERVNRLKKMLTTSEDNYRFAKSYNERIVKELNKKSEEMEKFNALPWWEKMFFKFDV